MPILKSNEEIIAEQMKKLPSEIREAILSLDYEVKLQEIYRRQRLLIDQAQKLETETSLVLLGLEPISDYVANLEKNLELTSERALEVAADVNENIFKQVRASLEKIDENMLSTDYFNEPVDEYASEPPVTKFTNTNETNLNRDQILKEIEDPSIIEREKESPKVPLQTTTGLEVRPTQGIKAIPGQEVKNIIPKVNNGVDILTAKLTEPTIITQKTTEIKPIVKLPDVGKKGSYSGSDPYREPII